MTRKTPEWPLLELSKLKSNPWNPNQMGSDEYEKTKKGIKRLIRKVGVERIPPLVVRKHPDKKNRFQIIDGEHRSRILEELGYEKGPCLILDVDTKTAMLLTEQLNHNRGSNDPKKYAYYLQTLVEEHGYSLEELEQHLPQSADDMDTLLQAQNIKLDEVKVTNIEEGKVPAVDKDDIDDISWVKLDFRVSASQAEIIEKEISRIGSVLDGKNVRGRALEYLAVNSSQTPLESVSGVSERKKSKKKFKSPSRKHHHQEI